jgi:hypothetical protein
VTENEWIGEVGSGLGFVLSLTLYGGGMVD